MITGRHRSLRPETLDDAQRALYDAIVGGVRAQGPQHFALTREDGSLRGPFGPLLLAPALGTALQAVGAAIRYEGSLSPREREIAILLVAAHWDSAFERDSHEAVGRAVGLTDIELEALRSGDLSPFTDGEGVVARVAVQLTRGDLDDDIWNEASITLGATTVFELTTLVGYYATLALQLRVFQVAD